MRRTALILTFALLLTSGYGCGKKTMVVLVADPYGTVGSVSVTNPAGTVALEAANEATTVRGPQKAPGTPAALEPEKIQALFSDALAARPLPPVHFILYFESGSDDLKPASLKTLADAVAAIKARAATDISVIGHSDTAGSKTYNMQLSHRRTASVAKLLVNRGVAQTDIKTTSHGEGNPLVKTGDNVSEPKNRRVEVVVR